MNDPAPDGGIASVWSALRRRKVVQWGIAYVAVAWGFLQGLEYVTESFQWPHQVRQVALLALLIGLPIVLVLAWYHGDRGEQHIRGTELGIIALLFLVGGGIFWLYDRAREDEAEGVKAQNVAPVASTEVVATAPDAKSIAVLPFSDMSPTKDQEYMSDGIAEELLNLLAKVPDLKVIARTSSFAFKGQNVEIAEIGRRLNVAHVLEGSVKKSGNTVRITAQLVRASDSTHLWSERYDRPLDDIFAVQDEIATAIVQALQIRLMGGTASREGGSQNAEAYELYLRAANARNQNTRSSLDAAIEYLKQAIELEPSYGLAWSLMAEAILLKTDNSWLEPKDGYERVRQLALHALQVGPDIPHAHAMLLYVHRNLDWDWAAAEAEGQRALANDPTNPTLLGYAGTVSRTLGRWNDAERQFRAALVRDPLNPLVIADLAGTYYRAGRYAEAEALYRKLLELQPNFAWTTDGLARTLLAQGKPSAALTVLQQEGDKKNRLQSLPIVLQAAGRQAEADEALKEQIAQWADTGAFYVAQTYAYRADRDRTLQWLQRAYKQKDPALVEIVGEHLFNNMVDDPRFKDFLRKMNLPEWPKLTATGS